MKHLPFSLTLFLILIIEIAPVLQAQSQFKIDAEFRPRFEFRDGYKKLLPENASPSFIISQRTRLSFKYQTDNLKIVFSPQDVRVWGDEQLSSSTGVFGDYASLDLFEGYVEIKAGTKTWVSIGRQQLIYDDEWLLSKRNWNQNGMAYDALVLKMNCEKTKLHIGSTWNSSAETSSDNLYPSNRYKSISFLWVNREINEKLQVSLFHMASGITETDTTNKLNFRQTTGLYSSFKTEKLKFRGSFYYQYGNNKSGILTSASLIDAKLSYSVGKLIPGIGISHISGNKEINGDTDNLFDVHYGGRHRFLGHMDYFTNLSSSTKQGGIFDIYAFLDFAYSKNLNITNTFHYFSLAQTNSLTPVENQLGFENELAIGYKINDYGTLKCGYLFYVPTDAFRILQGVTNNKQPQFVFIELTLKPSFLQ